MASRKQHRKSKNKNTILGMKPGVFLAVAAAVAVVAVGSVLALNKFGVFSGSHSEGVATPNPQTTLEPDASGSPVAIDEPDVDAVFTQSITIDGVSLLGLTRQQAYDTLMQANSRLQNEMVLDINFQEDRCTFPLVQYELQFGLEDALAEAQTAEAQGKSAEITQKVTVNEELLRSAMQQTADTYAVAPVDAFIAYPEKVDTSLPREQWFPVTDDIPGSQVDITTLQNAAMSAIATRSLSTPLTAEFEKVPAAVTAADVPPVQMELIGAMTTTLTNDKNRNTNVTLACGFVNGTVMVPGFEFSYNTIVGRRTAERGFKMAGVIVGGDRTEQGLGGGICQVSGTLYNTAVFANMTIVERHRHSYELGYLKRGRDATVDYGTKDLRFTNDGQNPVVIVMYVNNLKVTAEIYGTPLEDGKTIGIEVTTTGTVKAPAEVKYVADSSIERGKTTTVKARNGINCSVYKVWYDKNGKEITREKLCDDKYPAIQPKVYYNPKDPDPSITPTPEPTDGPTPVPSETVSSTPTPVVTPTPTLAPEPTAIPQDTATPGATESPD